MSDSVLLSDLFDRELIDLSDEYKAREWTQTLGVTAEELRDAVSTVGNSTSKVAEYLASHRGG